MCHSDVRAEINRCIRTLRARRRARAPEVQRSYDPFLAGQMEGLDTAIHVLLRAQHADAEQVPSEPAGGVV